MKHLALALVMGLIPFCGYAQENSVMTKISQAVSAVRASGDPEMRIENARSLAQYVKQNVAKSVNETVVLDIASLLEDTNDAVRYWAATALGYIGPNAKVAIPFLREALNKVDADAMGKNSASAILVALKKIEGRAEDVIP